MNRVNTQNTKPNNILTIFAIFLRIGLVGFGGPIALVALMEQELCHKRNWCSLDEFSQVFAICKLLPGPIAVQTAIYLSYKKAGRMAGFLAGLGLTLPALIMMLILSVLYMKYGNNGSHFVAISNFMQNAALAIIILVTFDLAKLYIKNVGSVIMLIITGILIFHLPTWEPTIIISSGFLGLCLSHKFWQKIPNKVNSIISLSATPTLLSTIGNAKLLNLFWICFKSSAFIFGTGLAIIPLLHGELVQHLHWMSSKQFIDGITLGQITPGPVSISVVFFGYVISGFIGTTLATLGFYLPPFIITLIILPLFWHRIVTSPYLHTFSLWAFPAIIGGIAGASVRIGMTSLVNTSGYITLICALFIAYKKFLPAWLIIPLAGLIGILIAYYPY